MSSIAVNIVGQSVRSGNEHKLICKWFLQPWNWYVNMRMYPGCPAFADYTKQIPKLSIFKSLKPPKKYGPVFYSMVFAHLEVSWNGGNLKSSIQTGCSITNHHFWAQFMETAIFVHPKSPHVRCKRQATWAPILHLQKHLDSSLDGMWGYPQSYCGLLWNPAPPKGWLKPCQ